ncbi:Hypothetical protein D9617_48g089530 [Elsinoe fawcettii]|nr:Hypothetical protein D9617_48g089530 [Elsinoe fawcettii]
MPDSSIREEEDYVSISIDGQDVPRSVKYVRVVVHTTGAVGQTALSGNHATMYLLFSNGRSVQINMNCEVDDINGKLTMKSRTYQTSRTQLAKKDIPTLTTKFTAKDVLQRIKAMGFQDFTFAGGGMGCRHWILTIIRDFESIGWLAVDSVVTLHQFLSVKYAREDEGRRHTSIIQGTFDAVRTQSFAVYNWSYIISRCTASVNYWAAVQPPTQQSLQTVNTYRQQAYDADQSARQGAELHKARMDEKKEELRREEQRRETVRLIEAERERRERMVEAERERRERIAEAERERIELQRRAERPQDGNKRHRRSRK